MGNMTNGLKHTINKLVTSAVADQMVEHAASQARGPVISENPPRVSGWKQHNVPGHEPTWSCPPWSGQAERDYTSKMSAICFSLRHQLLEHDRAVQEHKKTGEANEFTSTVLPADLHSLPKSIAADARRLLRAEGWM